MNLNIVIAQLRARAPIFGQRVAGASKFEVLPEAANLAVPAAYVIPTSEQPGDQISQNGYRQIVIEQFSVVVALSNRSDERGQAATGSLQLIREELFRALLGFQPTENYDAIAFEGGQMVSMDRARMYFEFEFSTGYEIGPADTWISVRDSELPDYRTVNIKLDALDPFDPNRPKTDFPADPLAYAGGKGPDGRIEVAATITLPL